MGFQFCIIIVTIRWESEGKAFSTGRGSKQILCSEWVSTIFIIWILEPVSESFETTLVKCEASKSILTKLLVFVSSKLDPYVHASSINILRPNQTNVCKHGNVNSEANFVFL